MATTEILDIQVWKVQMWLGETYPAYFLSDIEGNNFGSYPVQADGQTGGVTVKALIMALQLELGLTPDGVFGSGTMSACPTINALVVNSNIIKIIQGGFWCKGYNPGEVDGVYGNQTSNTISSFKEDLGFVSSAGSMTPAFVKCLLTTDSSKLTNAANPTIRSIQQYLNRTYYTYFGPKLGIISTDGLRGKMLAKGLIYALQCEEGMSASIANGNSLCC